MDNPTCFEVTRGVEIPQNDTELGEVKVMSLTTMATTSKDVQAIPCSNGGCKKSVFNKKNSDESPWHYLKTIYLIFFMFALIVWIIVYSLLSRYELL